MKSDSKILIVDDIPKNIQMAMNILKDEGYKMFYAKSGEMALKLVNEHDFDLILLDIMMPDMNGFDVCAKLKNEVKTKKIPVIFLTVKDDEKDMTLIIDVKDLDTLEINLRAGALNEKDATQTSSEIVPVDGEYDQQDYPVNFIEIPILRAR